MRILKFSLIGLANTLLLFAGFCLILIYAKFGFSLVLMLLLTLIFNCAMFVIGGRLLYRFTGDVGKSRYIWFTVLGWVMGFVLIFLDLRFGGILNSIEQLILELASARRTIFVNGTVVDFVFRDSMTIAVFLSIISNFIFFIITCLSIWITQIIRRKISQSEISN